MTLPSIDIPSKAEIWKWLGSAPLPVVLSICLTTSGVLGAWVYGIAAEVREQQTTAAVAEARAIAAQATAASNETRLIRIEGQLDRLLTAVATIDATTDRDRERRPQPRLPKEQTK